MQIAPQLLNLNHIPGIEYGLTLIIAIVGAEIFNQGNWQRVYAAKNKEVMWKGFLIAGLIIIPIILFISLFGFFAIAENVADNPSIALFSLITSITPAWIVFATMILAVALIMSSMDTLLNGIVSIFTVDFVRMNPQIKKTNLTVIAKGLTIIIAAAALIVATKGYSVLYLFLVADLVCVAAAFPTFLGLWSNKISGITALTTSIIGILAGSYYFPDPTYATGNLLWSFLFAFTIPAILSILMLRIGKPYDFKQLKKENLTLGK